MMGGTATTPHTTVPQPCSPFCPTQEVDAAEIQVQVCLYAFDLIYLNGQVSSAACLGADGGGVRAWEPAV